MSNKIRNPKDMKTLNQTIFREYDIRENILKILIPVVSDLLPSPSQKNVKQKVLIHL